MKCASESYSYPRDHRRTQIFHKLPRVKTLRLLLVKLRSRQYFIDRRNTNHKCVQHDFGIEEKFIGDVTQKHRRRSRYRDENGVSM